MVSPPRDVDIKAILRLGEVEYKGNTMGWFHTFNVGFSNIAAIEPTSRMAPRNRSRLPGVEPADLAWAKWRPNRWVHRQQW
jgi:hypothetical protein